MPSVVGPSLLCSVRAERVDYNVLDDDGLSHEGADESLLAVRVRGQSRHQPEGGAAASQRLRQGQARQPSSGE